MLSLSSLHLSSRTCNENEECHLLDRCINRVDDVNNNDNDEDYIRHVSKTSVPDGRQVPNEKSCHHATVAIVNTL